MLEIEMFPALNGDGLWLRYGTKDKPHHILIDCGFSGPTTPVVLAKIRERDPHFELFVLTHVDSDHIDGAVQLLLEPEITKERFGDVWFNSWQHIVDAPEDGDELGALQGEYFSAIVNKKKLPWNQSKPFQGGRLMVPADGDLPSATMAGGMKLTLLSPNAERLRALRTKWKAELKGKLAPGDWKAALELLRDDSRYASDALGTGEPNVAALAKNAFSEDSAVPNGSSLALLAEWKTKKLLLLGDAWPSVVANSLGRLGYSKAKPLHVDVLKLSHHGSRANTSPALLEMLTYDHVLISSNGNQHEHPNPETLARVVHDRDNVTLHFNYETEFTKPWIKLAEKKAFAAKSSATGYYLLDLP
jgi:hypothetical protein